MAWGNQAKSSSTFTGQSKNSATFSNQSRNSTTFSGEAKNSAPEWKTTREASTDYLTKQDGGLLLLQDSSRILLQQNTGDSWTGITKN